MELAHILSDLTSLLVCDNKSAAWRLISARPVPASTPAPSSRKRNASQSQAKAVVIKDENERQPDADLARAYTLLELHQDVKTAYGEDAPEQNGSSSLDELHDARNDVAKALRSLGVESISPTDSISGNHDEKLSKETQEHDNVSDDIEDEDEDISAWA